MSYLIPLIIVWIVAGAIGVAIVRSRRREKRQEVQSRNPEVFEFQEYHSDSDQPAKRNIFLIRYESGVRYWVRLERFRRIGGRVQPTDAVMGDIFTFPNLPLDRPDPDADNISTEAIHSQLFSIARELFRRHRQLKLIRMADGAFPDNQFTKRWIDRPVNVI